MTITNGREHLIIGPRETIHITSVFNSENIDDGGDFFGPIVVAGTAFQFKQLLTPSTVGLEFIRQTSAITMTCKYHFSIRNDSDDKVTFRIDVFYN